VSGPGLPPARDEDAPVPPPASLPGVALLAVALALFALAIAGLARHPAFQPTYTLRAAAPAIAIVLAAAYAHQVARRRARLDVPGEFDPGARALYLGLVMVAVAVAVWLDAAQAVPAMVNGVAGRTRIERAVVTERAPAAGDPSCPHRLSVASASIERPMDQCVAADVWAGAAVGGQVTLVLRASRLGAEIVDVRP
jgi:hypothetical protein